MHACNDNVTRDGNFHSRNCVITAVKKITTNWIKASAAAPTPERSSLAAWREINAHGPAAASC